PSSTITVTQNTPPAAPAPVSAPIFFGAFRGLRHRPLMHAPVHKVIRKAPVRRVARPKAHVRVPRFKMHTTMVHAQAHPSMNSHLLHRFI
ncbi:hypothetical protein ACYOEI_34610, partial [Singulisphaera rosea]